MLTVKIFLNPLLLHTLMTDASSTSHFLTPFLNPQSIAIYGANENVPNNMGSIQLLTLIDNGYQGAIYPIHPTLNTIFGLKTYKKIADIPGPVDLVEVILPKRVIPSVLEEIVAREPGNRNAWVRLGHNFFDSNQPMRAINAYAKDPRQVDDAWMRILKVPDVWEKIKELKVSKDSKETEEL